MSDLETDRAKVRQCAASLRRVASLLDAAVSVDLHPSIDWKQLITYVNEDLLLAADGSMWDDPDDHRKLYKKIRDRITPGLRADPS